METVLDILDAHDAARCRCAPRGPETTVTPQPSQPPKPASLTLPNPAQAQRKGGRPKGKLDSQPRKVRSDAQPKPAAPDPVAAAK